MACLRQLSGNPRRFIILTLPIAIKVALFFVWMLGGPIGSEYPGNIAVSLAACFFGFLSIRSARSALRRRRETGGQQSWEVDAGLSVVCLLFFAFALYAVWAHR